MNVAFCLGGIEIIKQTALFFDYVFPLTNGMFFKKDEQWFRFPRIHEIEGIVPSNVLNSITNTNVNGLIDLDLLLIKHFYYVPESTGACDICSFLNYIKAVLIQRNVVLDINLISSSTAVESSSAKVDDLSVLLSGIQLVNTEHASWDQILEYRKNEEAKKKLRNLRLFLMSNYLGKTRQFIEDDFGKRKDDYMSVVKEYGFQTKISTMILISDSKNLRAFGTTSLIAALMGEPLVATASVLAGASCEILKVSLELINKRHAFHKFKEGHDLAYIMDFQRQIEEPKSDKIEGLP